MSPGGPANIKLNGHDISEPPAFTLNENPM